MSAAKPFVHAERVRFGHLDAMRHLNNVEFLRFFETARIEFLRDIVPTHDPANPEGNFGIIFAECHINYRSPGHYDELIETELSIGDVRRSSFRVEFVMRVGDRLLAEGWGALVGFDYVTQRAAPLPEDVRATLTARMVPRER